MISNSRSLHLACFIWNSRSTVCQTQRDNTITLNTSMGWWSNSADASRDKCNACEAFSHWWKVCFYSWTLFEYLSDLSDDCFSPWSYCKDMLRQIKTQQKPPSWIVHVPETLRPILPVLIVADLRNTPSCPKHQPSMSYLTFLFYDLCEESLLIAQCLFFHVFIIKYIRYDLNPLSLAEKSPNLKVICFNDIFKMQYIHILHWLV